MMIFDELPIELKLHIMSMLSFKDYLSMSQVNKEIHSLSDEKQHWIKFATAYLLGSSKMHYRTPTYSNLVQELPNIKFLLLNSLVVQSANARQYSSHLRHPDQLEQNMPPAVYPLVMLAPHPKSLSTGLTTLFNCIWDHIFTARKRTKNAKRRRNTLETALDQAYQRQPGVTR